MSLRSWKSRARGPQPSLLTSLDLSIPGNFLFPFDLKYNNAFTRENRRTRKGRSQEQTLESGATPRTLQAKATLSLGPIRRQKSAPNRPSFGRLCKSVPAVSIRALAVGQLVH